MTNPAAAESGSRRRRRCDPRVLDQNACRVVGIAAQAAYNEKQAKAITEARTAYAGARARYVEARRAARPKVVKAGKDLGDLIEKIRCQLDDEDLERLDRAFAHVVERLDRCGSGRGCSCDDEDEDDDSEEVAELGRRAALERRTAEAAACFHRLIAEPGNAPGPVATPEPAPSSPAAPAVVSLGAAAAPAAETAPDDDEPEDDEDEVVPLPQRVEDLLAEIDQITRELAGNGDPVDLYAAAIVARRHLKTIWLGFDTVNDYVDCLCNCLTTMIDGHHRISVLVRRAAVEECYRKSWRAACRRLEEDAAAEVVAKYLRICADDDHGHDHDHDHGGYSPPKDEPGDDGASGYPRRDQPDDDEDDSPPPRRGRGPRTARGPEPDPDPAPTPPRRSARKPRRPYDDEAGGYRAP